jgi:hypothetical protein
MEPDLNINKEEERDMRSRCVGGKEEEEEEAGFSRLVRKEEVKECAGRRRSVTGAEREKNGIRGFEDLSFSALLPFEHTRFDSRRKRTYFWNPCKRRRPRFSGGHHRGYNSSI